jgi:histone acetyltransferase (RNA polymerase elongator complex component)
MKALSSGKRLIHPIFITHQGCPHRCVFCNQEVTTDWAGELPSEDHIQRGIVSFLRAVKGRWQRREVAFYGGTFTALSLGDQQSLLQGVYPFIEDNRINGIRISTRPDVIDVDRLDLLRRYGVETVEVGAQSMVDEILSNCWRGHTSQDVVQSVHLIRSMEFEVGIQIMLGLPGEDMDRFLTTVRRVIALSPDFARIYPLLVMKGSPLEKLYEKGCYVPIALKEAVRWAKIALQWLEGAGIPVIRVGLQPTSTLEASGTVLAGPYHPAFRSLVESSIFYDMGRRLLGGLNLGESRIIRFRTHPGDRSNLTGQRKENLDRLERAYGLHPIEILSDPGLPRGTVLLETSRGAFRVSREDLIGPHGQGG